MEQSSHAGATLEYAARGTTSDVNARDVPPWVAVVLAMPVPLFVLVLFTSGVWPKWFGMGQAWERLLGQIWLATLALSVLIAVALLFVRKRWYLWVCLGLHLALIVGTVLPPGCFMLAWLMHWLHGPGA